MRTPKHYSAFFWEGFLGVFFAAFVRTSVCFILPVTSNNALIITLWEATQSQRRCWCIFMLCGSRTCWLILYCVFWTSQEALKFRRLISSGHNGRLKAKDDIRHADHSLVVKNCEDVKLQGKWCTGWFSSMNVTLE